MIEKRIIPVLLIKNNGLVKTLKFKNSVYVGDPINAVKIFNEKLVDELIFLDIEASKEKRKPNLDLIYEIAAECFMPFSYGGGINNVEIIGDIIRAGAEKVIINQATFDDKNIIRKASAKFGSSTIVGSIDYKNIANNDPMVFTNNGRKCRWIDPISHALNLEEQGVGEIFINSIDQDGTMEGYDSKFIKKLCSEVSVPVIACGGAGELNHLAMTAKETGITALGAGSLFCFYKTRKAVLINYPDRNKIKNIFSQ